MGGLGVGRGVAPVAGFGELSGVTAMISVYGDGRCEASNLEPDSDEATGKNALQSEHIAVVGHATTAKRLRDSQQLDLGLVTIREGTLVESFGVDAEAKVPRRQTLDAAPEARHGSWEPEVAEESGRQRSVTSTDP